MEKPNQNELSVAWGWVKTGMLYLAGFLAWVVLLVAMGAVARVAVWPLQLGWEAASWLFQI